MKALNELILLPRPRVIHPAPGACPAGAAPAFTIVRGIPEQGYRLRITPDGIAVESNDDAGTFYARQTLDQLRRAAGGDLPCGLIEDHPDFAHRGLMLDISRNRVPTMDRLFALVDQLAALKFNHLELYIEHTFAYRNHRDVWEHASPVTAEEMRALDAHCRARFIELVPNQNSFGHLAPWLKLPRYRDLAECPDGHTAWGAWRPYPFSLNPLDPRSLALLDELYDELLPNFSSRRFNVGCDETVDLGQGRSKAACEARGKGRVYLDFLREVHARVARRGHVMHFWGDIILHHPELIPELPRDAVALVWGYEADHPFDRECAAFAQAGLPFWVCPGTSTWNSFASRTTNMTGNVRSAIMQGRRHGASGFLLTDWGDNGHWQPPSASWPAYAFGAAQSWCADAQREPDLAAALDLHVFRDTTHSLGQAALDLGDVHLLTGATLFNATLPFRALHSDDPADTLAKTTSAQLSACETAVASLAARIGAAQPANPEVVADFQLAAALIEAGLRRGRGLLDHSNSALKDRLPALIDLFRARWLSDSRPGGLADSLAPLERRRTERPA